jgi:signal transduction histidine kinase
MNGIKLGRSKVRVDALLQDAFHNIARRAQAREIRLALRVPAVMSLIYAEKELLRIALDNLLENALRYSEQGGSIEVEADETDHEILLIVRDDGLPIDVADQPHVFERFARPNLSGRRRPDGLGLGLYLANEIITLHAGRIVLASTPETGNVFTVHLNKPALAIVGPAEAMRSAVTNMVTTIERQTAKVTQCIGALGDVLHRVKF